MNPDSSSLARCLVPTYDPNEEHRFSIHQAVFDELGAQHATPNADYGRARRAYVKLRFKYNNNSKMIFLCQRVTLHILDNSLLDRTQHVVAIQSESEANSKKQIRRGKNEDRKMAFLAEFRRSRPGNLNSMLERAIKKQSRL